MIFFEDWRYPCYIQFVYRAGGTGGAKKEKQETKGKKKEFQARRNEKYYGGGGAGLGVYKKILTNLEDRSIKIA